MNIRPADPMGLRFLDHGGEMGLRIRDHDWSRTPLGPPATWPATLRTTLGLCLGSTFPTAIYWGPELLLLYNDAWSFIPAERHPECLGRPGAEVWQDIWDVVGPQIVGVFTSGKGVSSYDQPLTFLRDGMPVETWFTYSLSPIRDEGGNIVGVFNQGNETTRLVMAERRRAEEATRLREMFEQAPGPVALLHGRDLVIEYANDAYRRLVGDRALVGRTVPDALPEVAEAGFVEILHDVLDTGEAYRATSAPIPLFRHADGAGEVRLLDLVYQPIRDASGEVADVLVMANDVTDRARAEQALRDSDERLQLALDSSLSIGTWDWDVVANRVTADARFARIYGVDPAVAAEGASIEAFFGGIHPHDLPRVQAAIDATLTQGEPFIEEYRLVQSDGSAVWVVAQGRAKFDGAGRAVRFPGVSFDITQRRLAEEAARDAVRDLRAATEAQSFVYRLADGMRRLESPTEIMRLAATALGTRMAADRVNFIRILNDAVAQFDVGWSNGNLHPTTGTIPMASMGVLPVAEYQAGRTRVVGDYADQPSDIDAVARQDAGASIGVPLLRQGRWTAGLVVQQAHPRRWTPEEVALVEAVAETAWDSVDRAQAAAALRDSEGKFRAIANSIDQMVWATRADGFHDYFNERWYEFTGVPHGSTDGEGWEDVFHPGDHERTWAAWRHSLATGDPYRIEYRLRHHSGAYRWVLGSALPVRDDSGAIVRWFGTCTDIEEQVAARQILARSQAELEAAIAVRTEQLMATEAQLRQAQKMEAVGQLTGGIAHDFNNMLAVVIGALDLLERRIARGNTDVGRYVEAARDGANRAAALTQRLLSFSRQSTLEPARTDLNALVAGMTDMLDRTLGDATLVETRLDPDLWPARTDRGGIENAILNLAVNARDAMPRGGRLTIETANLPLDAAAARPFSLKPGDYVAVAVRDTGSGMDAEVAARAFDPFFTTKAVGKGTGLGLSQVFGFARQSGGHVAIDSAPGAGTTVRILLPRDSGDANAVHPVPTPTSPIADLPHGSETILVVEDEDRVRSYSTEALGELGYTVLSAHDGPTALAIIERGEAIDLLFTDVVMPEMTGRELAEAARWHLPSLRVLYTSGYTRDEIESTGPAAAGVLRKPFDVATLALRIRAALDGDAATR